MLSVIWDFVVTGLRWIAMGYLIANTVMLVYVIGTALWQDSIKPRLIPRETIARIADEITSRFPDDPDYAAYSELETAWWRSEADQQVKWKRVLKEIRRREALGRQADKASD